jgi:hypothetical protein
MAMRYDIRTGMMQPDEPAPNVPGWQVPAECSVSGPRRYTYDLRIGDAERDTAMEQLREHFAAGRLTLDELTERIDFALTAKTQTQIDALMADLPRPRRQPAQLGRPADENTDTGRYIVSMLVLFALAAIVLVAILAQFHGYGGPPP